MNDSRIHRLLELLAEAGDLARELVELSEAMDAPRIDPALVEAFKRDPSNRTANAVIAAIEAATSILPIDTRLEDGPMAGLVLRGGDGRLLFHIGPDGRLNAVPDSAPAAEVPHD